MSNTPSLPPAGWYPDVNTLGQERYWDGAAWTVGTRPITPATGATHQVAGTAVLSPPKKRKKWPWIVGGSVAALLLLIIIIGSANAGKTPATAANDEPAVAVSEAAEEATTPAKPVMIAIPELIVGMTAEQAVNLLNGMGLDTDYTGAGDSTVTATTPAAGTEVETGSTVSLTVQEKPKLSLAQENALEAAQSYLENMSFSRQGLIDQLSSQYGSAFPVDVATWAADAVGADWNAEAAEAAKSYLDNMSFSRQGLYDQLTSQYGSQFTPEQANFALAAVGY